jgi:hypothetical protein
VDDTANPQLLINRKKGNDISCAQFGSSGPIYIYDGALVCPGVTSRALLTADSAGLDLAGDLDIRLHIRPANIASGTNQELLNKWLASAGARSYRFAIEGTGLLQFAFSPDGTANTGRNSSVVIPVTNGNSIWVRVTLDADSGGGTHIITFYTSSDGVTWTQLGSTVTPAGVATIFNTTTQLAVGGFEGGTSPFKGLIKYAELRDGIYGTVVYKSDFSSVSDFSTSFVNSTSQTCTLLNTSSVDANDPLLLSYNGEQYINLPAVAQNAITTPHNTVFNRTAHEAVFRFTPNALATPAYIYGKFGGTNRSYRTGYTNIGRIDFTWSTDGTAGTQSTLTTTASLPSTTGVKYWVKVQFNPSDAGSATLKVYYQSDTGTNTEPVSGWTQLGATVSAAVSSIFASTAEVFSIGSESNTGSGNINAKINYFALKDGIDGSVVVKFDSTLTGQTGYTDVTNSIVWTIVRSSTGRKTSVVDRSLALLGTDDYFEVLNNEFLNFELTDSFTIVASIRLGNTTVGSGAQCKVIEKANAAAYTAGFSVYFETTGNSSAKTFFAGTVGAPTSAITIPANIVVTRSMIRNVGEDILYNNASSSSGQLSGSIADPSTGSGSNAFSLRIGASSLAAANQFLDAEFFAAAVFRRILSDAEIERVRLEMNSL